jgi:phosphate-selective porin OprO/OprP
LFVERPFISNNVVFAGREYQNALSYDTHAVPGLMAMAAVYEANTANDKDAAAKQATTANGHGYSARVTYAPVMTDAVVVHFGASYDDVAWKTGAGANAPAVAVPYVARNGPTLPLIAAAAYDGQKTPTGELALRFGPFFFQGEYAQAKYAFTAGPDQDVTAWYAQASVFVTGEAKPYKPAGGVFGNPKPAHVEFGAVELKARYDHVQNEDAAAQPEATLASFGVNYYFNPNLRIMADYNLAKAETLAGKDEPKAVVLRGQLYF